MDERRRWAGSWLGGVRSAGVDLGYPGERYGLPETGPGSVARYGRRLGALFADWILATIVAVGIFRSANGWNMLVFALEYWLLIATTGASIGHRLFGLAVLRLDNRPVGFGWSLARTALLVVIVPALLMDRDYRGLHDRASNTIVVRRPARDQAATS